MGGTGKPAAGKGDSGVSSFNWVRTGCLPGGLPFHGRKSQAGAGRSSSECKVLIA